jgi:hypothetical protein
MKNLSTLKNKFMMYFLFTFVFSGTYAQTKSFGITVNKDSVLLGNTIKVEFTMENVKGKFEGPDFKDFDVLSGPNSSTSMYSINGETTTKSVYSYYIKPRKSGDFFIENAYLATGKEEDNMETSPYKIVVLENPQGIIDPAEEENGSFNNMFFSFPSGGDLFNMNPFPKEEKKEAPKPKRKIKRI